MSEPLPPSSTAPRPWLHVLGWILSVAIIAVAIGHQTRRLHSVHFQGGWYFPDTDDYMRLFRVRLILDGKAAIVRHIAELNPPQGVTLHWTAPMDYVLVLATKFAAAFSGAAHALEPAAAWTPVLLGGFYVALVIRLMRRGLGWGPALVGGLLVALSRSYHVVFQLGHCDHHCLIELCQWTALAALWPNRRSMDNEPTRAFTIISGAAMGVALWVAAQAMLVWAAIFIGLTFATFHTSPDRQAIWLRRRRTWNLTVLTVLICGWLIEQWPALARPELDKISLFHVLLGALALFVPGGRPAAGRSVFPQYTALAAGLMIFGIWFFAHRAAMTAIFARPEFYYWSAVITELQPLYLHADGQWSLAPIPYTLGYLPFFLPIALPIFLLNRELHCAAKTTLAILASAITMLCIFQFRWIDHFNLAVMPVSVIALHEIWRRITRKMNTANVQEGIHPRRAHATAKFLPSIFAAAALAALQWPSIVRALAMAPEEPSRYALRATLAAEAINHHERQAPSDASRRAIMAEQEAGPTLLWHTGLPVLAGPYHRALDGQLEAARFFAERDIQAARQQLDRLGVKYVVAPNDPIFNLRTMERIAFGQPRSYEPSQYKIEDGELVEGVSPKPEIEQTMAYRLYYGTNLAGLRVSSVARARESGPEGEQMVGFVYVVSEPAPTTTQGR